MIMQPSYSREMQEEMNSLLNSSQISLEDLQGQHINHQQIQAPSQMHHQFDPQSHDDFLEQILSTMEPDQCSWPELDPTNPKPLWDLKPSNSAPNNVNHPADLSDETPPDNINISKNVGYHNFDQQANLASKFRNHQISANSSPKSASAAALMLQHQLLMSRGGSLGSGESGLLQMPLSLGGGDFERDRNDVVDAPSFKPPNPVSLEGSEGSVQALYNGFGRSLNGSNQPLDQSHQFHHPQMQGQNYGAQEGPSPTNQGSSGGGASAQPRQRVRARRGQATDPHSIAERLRRERIAERMKALQELVPNANKTDKASMLDEIIDYVKFLQLQVKVLSMSRLGGAAAVAPLVADMSYERGGDGVQANENGGGLGRNSNGNESAASSSNNDSLTMTEHQVAKLMEEDMGSAMQYLQGKGLCLMPISLATAISTATCHSRNPMMNSTNLGYNRNCQNAAIHHNSNPAGEGPSSPSMSVLTVQSATLGNGGGDCSVKDAISVTNP